jgi:hypothetical protein
MKKNMNNLTEFNPTKAEIQATVAEVENLTIAGVEDVAGYEAVKAGKKRLADYRIKITKYGKEQREEAIKWQREVLRQENELLAMISPTENALKAKMEAIDQEKKRAERAILLPSRRKMLEGLPVVLTDDQLLDMNEAQFSIFFAEAKRQAMEAEEVKKAEEERKKQFAIELEEAKKKAAEQAIINENARIAREAVEKEKAEKREQKRLQRNHVYKNWLEQNGVTGNNTTEFDIRQTALINSEGTKYELYKKVSEIIIA